MVENSITLKIMFKKYPMTELSVINAKHLADHILEVTFSDGHISAIDFAPFIFTVGHPDYELYKSIDNFSRFNLEDGNLNWDDYTMIFPIEDLYANNLIKNK